MGFPLLAASLPCLLDLLGPLPKESPLGDQNMPPPNMPLWHKDYFEFEANEMQKEIFPFRPLVKVTTPIGPLSWGSFMATKMEKPRAEGV